RANDRTINLRQATSLPSRVIKELWFPWRMQSIVANGIEMVLTGSRNSAESVSRSMDIPIEHIRRTPYGVDEAVMRPLPDAERRPATILFVGDSEDRNK